MPPDDGGGADQVLSASAKDLLDPIKERLEKESAQWAFLAQVDPVAAPRPNPDAEDDPWLLDEELRRFVGMRNQWDGTFGHLALVFRSLEGWRYLGFAGSSHHLNRTSVADADKHVARFGVAHGRVRILRKEETLLHASP